MNTINGGGGSNWANVNNYSSRKPEEEQAGQAAQAGQGQAGAGQIQSGQGLQEGQTVNEVGVGAGVQKDGFEFSAGGKREAQEANASAGAGGRDVAGQFERANSGEDAGGMGVVAAGGRKEEAGAGPIAAGGRVEEGGGAEGPAQLAQMLEMVERMKEMRPAS